jgi:ribosomal protein L7Ae-like RNA K-turn-binding protein
VGIVANSQGFVKYRRVFDDLDEIAAQVEKVLLQPSLGQTIKKLERTAGNASGLELKNLLNDALRTKQKGSKKVREYVDLAYDAEEGLESLVVDLVLRLKQLYYNRKMKQPKAGRKQNKMLNKKRYIVGLREVNKHLRAGEVKMVIVATDLEKVEDENGIDQVVAELIHNCRKMKVPLVFSMTKRKLGCLSKSVKQKASAVGIQNFQGANEIFLSLVERTAAKREEFYQTLAKEMTALDLILLRKENPFLNWDHPALWIKLNDF